MNLVDKDSLLAKLEAERQYLVNRGHLAAEHHVVHHALRIVYDEPTVDAEPVRHGKWRIVNVPKKWGGATLRCTECNTGATRVWNYCPNCGAKMDGGEENDHE